MEKLSLIDSDLSQEPMRMSNAVTPRHSVLKNKNFKSSLCNLD